jgi:hypothetical protein
LDEYGDRPTPGWTSSYCNIFTEGRSIGCIDLRNLTDEQKRAKIIADHKLALNGAWNDELLRLELTNVKELGADLERTGFDAMEMADILQGKDVEFKGYDESAADDVQRRICPKVDTPFQN